MKIQQFENKFLSHFSYAILSETAQQVILIDPSRNPQPYLDYANEHNAQIVGVIETHPHADFVSSHLEFYEKYKVPVYVSSLALVSYPFAPLDEGAVLEIGEMRLKALNTPGHSPDSISIVLECEGKDVAVFTGDTLFIGDCGRPDLRENGGNEYEARVYLAQQMYASLRNKLMKLADEVLLYPAHGAGTLCGKVVGNAHSSTIGAEKMSNWSLQEMTAGDFVKELTADQPFIPLYFPYNVQLNKQGAAAFNSSIEKVKIYRGNVPLEKDIWIVDSRDEKSFKAGHQMHSVNIMEGPKFETWLGSIIKPLEAFYLVAKDEATLKALIQRTASIGYEAQLKGAYFAPEGELRSNQFDLEAFKKDPSQYTIVDVRNEVETRNVKIFPHSLSIPLGELRAHILSLPLDKPIAVHCAGGYRSAAASALLEAELNGKAKVYDIGEHIKDFI
ncbi:MBL fold metallo-hydrolase [Pedobacter sp.]|uniref:MBL fold metallo-hydrolase n=1 Tax=Pedobacter sp. TaxID=1411316 RepID=UPI003D7FC978